MASLAAEYPPLALLASPLRASLRIVSFVVFGAEDLYTRGAVENARLLPLLYPGWVGRFYVGDDVPLAVAEALRAQGSEVVHFARAQWPGRAAQLLRFRPCGEAGVDVVAVRDADSRVNPREAAAVAEWLGAGKRFHIMHESMHDARYGSVMGGMWGCRRIAADAGPPDDRGGGDGEGERRAAPIPGLAEAVDAFAGRGEVVSEGEGGCGETSSATKGVCRRGDVEGCDAGNVAVTVAGGAYGDDMAFLDACVAPLVTAGNAMHHVDGDRGRDLGAALPTGLPRLPFPASPFRGFVGAPVVCRCPFRAFAGAGCGHCSRVIPGLVASRLGLAPDALASLGGFLG